MDESDVPKHKVELHVHLDGAARISTLWEVAQQKGLKLNYKTEEEFGAACRVTNSSTLAEFLQPFSIFIPIIAGDIQALERISYEFMEDAAKEKILYVEARYMPHILSTNEVPITDVAAAISRGLNKGSQQFGVKVRSIIASVRGNPEWCDEVVELCDKFKSEGAVGIDLCADQNAVMDISQQEVAAYKKAASKGIHRTIHVGEGGPVSQVLLAVNEMLAERLGHGYFSVDYPDIYKECLEKGIHFETCPLSSVLTGAAGSNPKHPIVQFAEDNVSFSISRDDPTIIQKSLEDDYNFLRGFGLKDLHFVRANFNAAHNSFLPDDEKAELLKRLRILYGIDI